MTNIYESALVRKLRMEGKCDCCGRITKDFARIQIHVNSEIIEEVGQYQQKPIPMGTCKTPEVFSNTITQVIRTLLFGKKASSSYEFKRMPMGNCQVPKMFSFMLKEKTIDKTEVETPSKGSEENISLEGNDFFALQDKVIEKVLSGDKI